MMWVNITIGALTIVASICSIVSIVWLISDRKKFKNEKEEQELYKKVQIIDYEYIEVPEAIRNTWVYTDPVIRLKLLFFITNVDDLKYYEFKLSNADYARFSGIGDLIQKEMKLNNKIIDTNDKTIFVQFLVKEEKDKFMIGLNSYNYLNIYYKNNHLTTIDIKNYYEKK